MSKVALPKAAEQLMADAKAAAMEVSVSPWDSVGVTVTVTSSTGRTASATWTAGSFNDGPPSRLGFHTTPGRPGVRFDYASAFNPNASRAEDRYPVVNSVRKMRAFVGLEV